MESTIDGNKYINIFPNPSTGIFSFKSEGADRYTYQVPDSNGKVVKQGNSVEHTIDLSKFASRFYYVRYTIHDGPSGLKKIILMR